MYGSKKQTQEIRALRKVGGKWLKEQREAVGLSQRDLASEVGLPYSTFISHSGLIGKSEGAARRLRAQVDLWPRLAAIPAALFDNFAQHQDAKGHCYKSQ